MIDRLLQLVAPHHCYGCLKVGPLLCWSCKNCIVDEPFSGCIVCRKPSIFGICNVCKTHYGSAYCVSERTDATEALLNGYKFDRQVSGAKVLAELLDETLPHFPADSIVVPVPTIAEHIRQRGYDHTLLLARHLASLRNYDMDQILRRNTKSVQRGANRVQRRKQAKTAFGCSKKLSAKTTYVLLDDVVTTGATLEFAAKTLHDAGARNISIAVIARQPMKK